MTPDGAAARPERDITTDAAPRACLLVVDDQPVNIQAIYQLFAADYRILMATRGEQALQVASEYCPDLILLDVEMPGMDGYEVCRRLKASAATSGIPVIFVTARDEEESEMRGLNVGAVDFITKPIKPGIVRSRVKTHLLLKHQSDLLRQLANTDALTGLPNRRYLDERLVAEWGRARRTSRELAVLMIDVDYFKRYNDSYGHLAGDGCLARVAKALRDAVRRPGDMVARYGGEEFCCLLPETDLAGAIEVAQTMVSSVRALQLEHKWSDAGVVTVSIGVCASGDLADAAELTKHADDQLYVAKQAGRNRAAYACSRR